MRIDVLLSFLISAACVSAGEYSGNENGAEVISKPAMTPIAPGVTVEQAMSIIVDAMKDSFPAAYKQFLNVAFTYSEDGETLPEKAEFYVPARVFDDPVDEKALLESAKRMAHGVGGTSSCTGVELGGTERLGWSTWPDKVVRKVTVEFYFYC